MLRFILCHARRPVSCPSTNPLFAGSNPAPPPLPGMQEVSSLSVKLEAKSALHTELRNRAGHLSAEALRATEEERERSGEVQRAASVHQDALRAVEDINQRVRGRGEGEGAGEGSRTSSGVVSALTPLRYQCAPLYHPSKR